MNWYSLTHAKEIKIDQVVTAEEIAGEHLIVADEYGNGVSLRAAQRVHILKEPVSIYDMREYADEIHPLSEDEKAEMFDGTPPDIKEPFLKYVVEVTELIFLADKSMVGVFFD